MSEPVHGTASTAPENVQSGKEAGISGSPLLRSAADNGSSADAVGDTDIFPFSPPACEHLGSDLKVTAHLQEGEILGMGCYQYPSQVGQPAKTFKRTALSPIAEEFEPGPGDARSDGSSHNRNFRKQKLVDLRNQLSIIQELGWAAFWTKAEGSLIPAEVFASILWMAEVLETFGTVSQLTAANISSVHLSEASLEVVLGYSRDGQDVQIVRRILKQLQKTLDAAGITEVEFLIAVGSFAAILKGFEDVWDS